MDQQVHLDRPTLDTEVLFLNLSGSKLINRLPCNLAFLLPSMLLKNRFDALSCEGTALRTPQAGFMINQFLKARDPFDLLLRVAAVVGLE